MYVHRTNNGKRIAQYTCSQYSKVPVGVLCSTQHRINAEVVLTLIADMLRAIAEYSKNDRAQFIRAVTEAQETQQKGDVAKKKKRLVVAQIGKLPESRYAALDEQYAKEQGALSDEIKGLEAAIDGYEQSRKSADKFIALVEKYESFDTLTTPMLLEFVEKILVHERDRKGSIETTQEVEIFFNFVGRYVPPRFGEVTLTPEEQEELRKKEERKDKLHRAYLQRKASGAQKRYEDKIKAAKKAGMDAKKDALRAEDISKGVFVPVSHLPKGEPVKAALPAAVNQ